MWVYVRVHMWVNSIWLATFCRQLKCDKKLSCFYKCFFYLKWSPVAVFLVCCTPNYDSLQITRKNKVEVEATAFYLPEFKYTIWWVLWCTDSLSKQVFFMGLLCVVYSEAKTQLAGLKGWLQALGAWHCFRLSLLVLQQRLWKGTAWLVEFINDKLNPLQEPHCRAKRAACH